MPRPKLRAKAQYRPSTAQTILLTIGPTARQILGHAPAPFASEAALFATWRLWRDELLRGPGTPWAALALRDKTLPRPARWAPSADVIDLPRQSWRGRVGDPEGT